MATLKMTVSESGFSNIASATYVGDCYKDEPGEPHRHLFRVTVPTWCKSGYTEHRCVILVDDNGDDRAVVTGTADGRFCMLYLGGNFRDEHPLAAERLI